MKALVSAAVSGALFAVGLALSGMNQPGKVISFLDFFGDFDPSLGLVMAGAIAVYLPLQRRIYRRQGPVFAAGFHLPDRKHLEPRLIIGAALFGVGWGLAGYCPAPGLSSIVSGSSSAVVFVVALVGGVALARAFEGRQKSTKADPVREGFSQHEELALGQGT